MGLPVSDSEDLTASRGAPSTASDRGVSTSNVAAPRPGLVFKISCLCIETRSRFRLVLPLMHYGGSRDLMLCVMIPSYCIALTGPLCKYHNSVVLC